MSNVDKIIEFLSKIEPILLIVIPAVFVVWTKVKSRIKQESAIVKNEEIRKSKEKYEAWVHDESRRAILKIKELCNVYKDRSHADQVLYMQLENGTTANSKLYNMFVTCLAEDNRYGEIPKRLIELQRIPYSQVAEWVEAIGETKLIISDIKQNKENWNCPVLKDAASHISAAVYNKSGHLTGIIVFNYKNSNFNGFDESQQINFIENFRTAIETVFLAYYISQCDKKKELRITEDTDESNRFFI